jgi:hypothetical protein
VPRYFVECGKVSATCSEFEICLTRFDPDPEIGG